MLDRLLIAPITDPYATAARARLAKIPTVPDSPILSHSEWLRMKRKRNQEALDSAREKAPDKHKSEVSCDLRFVGSEYSLGSVVKYIPFVKRIQIVVAADYKISRDCLLAQNRCREYAFPRQIAMYLAKTMTHHALPQIGKFFGGRDHTTALHAIRKIQRLIDAGDEELIARIERLKRQIDGSVAA